MKNGFKLIQIEPELTLWFIKRLIRSNQRGWKDDEDQMEKDQEEKKEIRSMDSIIWFAVIFSR